MKNVSDSQNFVAFLNNVSKKCSRLLTADSTGPARRDEVSFFFISTLQKNSFFLVLSVQHNNSETKITGVESNFGTCRVDPIPLATTPDDYFFLAVGKSFH